MHASLGFNEFPCYQKGTACCTGSVESKRPERMQLSKYGFLVNLLKHFSDVCARYGVQTDRPTDRITHTERLRDGLWGIQLAATAPGRSPS